jgi:hypothetical protein
MTIRSFAVVSCVVVGVGGIRFHALQPKREGRLSIDPNPVLETLRRSNNTQELVYSCNLLKQFCRPVGYDLEHSIGNTDQTMLLELGADAVIVAAMRRHPDDFSVQHECGLTICSIAQWEGCRETDRRFCGEAHRKLVVEDGILDLMTQAYVRFPELIAFPEWNMAVFTDFAGPDSEIMQRLADTGISAFIISQMIEHKSDGMVVISGLQYFSNACAQPRINRQMVDAGFLEASPQWMLTHALDLPVVRGEVTWDVFRCFTHSEEHLARLADAGIIPQTVDMIASIGEGTRNDVLFNERAFVNAIGLLGRLAEGNETRRSAIRNAGAGDAISRGVNKLKIPEYSVAEVTRGLGILQINPYSTY